MDPVIETDAVQAGTIGAAAPATADIGRVLEETRTQFVNAFSGQCDTIAHAAGAAADSTGSALAINVLHRMAGLAGTIGFPQVSTRAAELEDGLRAATLDADQVRGGCRRSPGGLRRTTPRSRRPPRPRRSPAPR